MQNYKIAITALSLLLSAILSAQQIQTDRPNETEGAAAVSKHELQLESGFSFEERDSEPTFEIPEIVLRYGISKNAEVRLESALQRTNQTYSPIYGFKPLTVGFKYHILDHNNITPDIAVLGRLSIPWLADKVYQEPKYGPELRLLFQHELSKTSHIGYNAGLHWTAESAAAEYIYTVAADHSISKKLKIVIETYGFAQPHHHAQNTADLALLFLANNDLQLDFITGSGITHSSAQKFVELGLSFRI